MSTLMDSLERLEPNPEIPPLRPGDTVKVHNRIVEGSRERVQVFQGEIIRVRRAPDCHARRGCRAYVPPALATSRESRSAEAREGPKSQAVLPARPAW